MACRRQPRVQEHRLLAGLLAAAVLHGLTPNFAAPPRRAVLAAQLGALLASSPAHAGLPLKSFGSGGFKEYTVGNAYQVSMPDNYKVLSESPTKVTWQGDRQGDLNTMTAQVQVVEADTLEKALNMEGLAIRDIGEKLSDKRPFGGSDFMGVEKLEDAGAYRFEFVNDKIHEYILLGVIKKDSQNLLCTVITRAPGLLWSNGDRYQTFAKIMSSFKPIV
mmetsp:Transcript_118395/g.281037  ORF Transcript_118395/g.281037 Transcript_118395/m.281037 type:complete len:219 (+) Transcript_118395:50-706(+)